MADKSVIAVMVGLWVSHEVIHYFIMFYPFRNMC